MLRFFEKNDAFTAAQVAAHSATSDYWKNVGLFQSMVEGMVDGYNSAVEDEKQLTKMDFLIMQAMGDLFDLLPAVDVHKRLDWLKLTAEEIKRAFLKRNHCSVLLKLKEDMSDMFLGHNSWNEGQVMIRIYKFYYFGQDLMMQETSYPGTLFSLDEYYILERPDQQIFITQTTNNNFNSDLYKLVTPNSLLCWMRVMVANVMATNGYEWTHIIQPYNSGTYNNQYMVIDTKQFVPHVGPKPGFFWVVEQMPGLMLA
jgi:hypothetical protein